MLTRAGYALLSASTILFVAGLPTGNLYVITLSLLPLAFFLLTAVGTTPRSVRTQLILPERAVRVGDEVTLRLRYEVEGGTGLLELHQPLPGLFRLTEGSNIHLLPKRPGNSSGELRFTVRVPRRGRFVLGRTDWELVPSLGFAKSVTGRSGTEQAIEVRPALTSFKRMVNTKARAQSFFPENDEARMGIQTTEFRDIREYVKGDPPRTINWKATARVLARSAGGPGAGSKEARRASARRVVPLVNQYEFEGKKSVWVYLDCGPHMRVGTSAENAFEVALQAAAGVAQFFIDRGYQVGFSLFNRPDPFSLYPDVGQKQMLKIHETLAQVDATDATGDFPLVVQQTKRFLMRGRSLVVVLTRADAADAPMLAGLRTLRGISSTGRRRRRRVPVMVLSPDPYGLLPDTNEGSDAARTIRRFLDQERVREVRRVGVEVLTWDPRKTRFQNVLVRRAATR